MPKWFENMETNRTNVVCSRIRLARNWKEYSFPSRLEKKDAKEMVRRLEAGLMGLGQIDGRDYVCRSLEDMDELERISLQERKVLNETLAKKKGPASILISEGEDVSVALNGSDHIRILLMAPGLDLENLWRHADQIDNDINSKFDYCFDDKYGYLTTYPTNLGTGLRTSVILHLPTLSLGRKFNNMINEMGRFGASIKGVQGEGAENYGALYEVSNLKTLGSTEKEIIDLVNRVAGQLNSQERQVRELSLKNHRLEREDEAYKSYGVLKYARRLAMKDAMTFLSQLMAGIHDGLLIPKESCSVYKLMLGIQPAGLSALSDRPLGKEELDVARAAYLRSALPELK